MKIRKWYDVKQGLIADNTQSSALKRRKTYNFKNNRHQTSKPTDLEECFKLVSIIIDTLVWWITLSGHTLHLESNRGAKFYYLQISD